MKKVIAVVLIALSLSLYTFAEEQHIWKLDFEDQIAGEFPKDFRFWMKRKYSDFDYCQISNMQALTGKKSLLLGRMFTQEKVPTFGLTRKTPANSDDWAMLSIPFYIEANGSNGVRFCIQIWQHSKFCYRISFYNSHFPRKILPDTKFQLHKWQRLVWDFSGTTTPKDNNMFPAKIRLDTLDSKNNFIPGKWHQINMKNFNPKNSLTFYFFVYGGTKNAKMYIDNLRLEGRRN